ncbi:MAG: hypothetical protein GF355_00745, partial [Candidatus Eisenbacteria bacterium]|nr:hypothetical protein [Candidatus Eisenbacteria bacterium]
MSLSRMSVERPVLTTVLITIFLVLGIFSYLRLVVDLFPEIEFPFVTVTTIYPGAGPEEVESQVTEELEDAVATLADIRRLDSINREGLSLLLIEFELGVDVDFAAIDVKEKVEGVLNELPDAVERPQVLKFDIQEIPVMSLALTGERSPRELYELADRRVRDDLSRASGVASVDIVGGLKREIQVSLDPGRLIAYGLDATQVAAAVGRENISVPAGRITRPGEELTVRALGEFTDLDQLRRLPVAVGPGGESVRIEDLGRVIDGTEEMRDLALANGRNSVGLFIQKRTDANTVETAAAVRRRVAGLNESLPEDVSLEMIRDRSTFIRRAVRDVIINIFLGILLTTVILYLFLHSMRSTVVAAVAMPTSIVATFLLIDFAGFTVNVMTLLALGISIGVLVANAIVVLESISRRIEKEGEDSITAARRGTDQVAVAVAAAALTNIVVFTPIAFMGGIVGQFFVQFGLTVVFATLFSLLVSFTLTPMLASRLLKSKKEREARPGPVRRALAKLEAPLLALAKAWDRGYSKVEERYASSLHWSIRYRVRTAAVVSVIFIGSMLLFRFVGGEFLPQSDEGFVQILVELPAGSTLEQTRDALEEAAEMIRREVPETEAMLMTIGGENKSVEDGEITLRLSDAEVRERGIFRIMNELRPHLAGIPAADVTVQVGGGFGDEKDIVVEVLGPELDVIRSLADSIRAEMAQIPGLVDVDVSAEPGKPEIVFRPDRQEMA